MSGSDTADRILPEDTEPDVGTALAVHRDKRPVVERLNELRRVIQFTNRNRAMSGKQKEARLRELRRQVEACFPNQQGTAWEEIEEIMHLGLKKEKAAKRKAVPAAQPEMPLCPKQAAIPAHVPAGARRRTTKHNAKRSHARSSLADRM